MIIFIDKNRLRITWATLIGDRIRSELWDVGIVCFSPLKQFFLQDLQKMFQIFYEKHTIFCNPLIIEKLRIICVRKSRIFSAYANFFGRIYAPHTRPPKFRNVRIFRSCVETLLPCERFITYMDRSWRHPVQRCSF